LLWAAILGWLIWRDVPTLPIVIGNAIIIGSGLYVAARGKMIGKAVVTRTARRSNRLREPQNATHG
jgi:drug/metabolite transporter (DMT)-like permease